MQFVVEIARRGGYLTTNMMNSSKDGVLEMESAIVSGGFDINRCIVLITLVIESRNRH